MSEKNLLEAQLQQSRASNAPRTLLINGKMRLTGIVKAFDSHMVVMGCNNTIHLVYRHSITEISEVRAPARPEAAAVLKPAHPRERGRERAGSSMPSSRERKPPQASPRPHKEPEKPAPQPQTTGNPMPGALGEELRKWLQRSGK